MNVKWASDVGKEIKSVYAAGKSIAFLPSEPSEQTIYRRAGQMTETAPQAGSPPLATLLVAALKRLATSALPFVVVILIWQFASLFFPRFLFPSLVDVFSRCLEIFSTGRVRRRAGDRLSHSRRPCRRLRGRRHSGVADGALAGGRQVSVADPVAFPGHSRAVLGGVRDHLVSWRRAAHLLHHGDDDAAGLHLPGAGCATRHVAGPDGDGVQLSVRRG